MTWLLAVMVEIVMKDCPNISSPILSILPRLNAHHHQRFNFDPTSSELGTLELFDRRYRPRSPRHNLSNRNTSQDCCHYECQGVITKAISQEQLANEISTDVGSCFIQRQYALDFLSYSEYRISQMCGESHPGFGVNVEARILLPFPICWK